jgi:V/A-type H+-transporting ATPase subunit I
MGAVALGMVCIVIVMLVNIINGIKQKNYKKILFDYNGAAGLLLYVGVIATLILLFNIGGSLFTLPFVIVFFIIPLVLIFLREPLGNLVARKKDWMPKNVGEYALENFFELLEILLSFVTNTISFIRVGAFALSHTGMMMVVFILAQGASGNQNMAVVIIGNIVVIGLEGLLVGIQVLRLHYFEFFSRFYDGEGREFTPVKINYNKNSF